MSEHDVEWTVQLLRRIVERSSAVFGYVFEFKDGGRAIHRGYTFGGRITDDQTRKDYFRLTGERAAELRPQGEAQVVPMGAPEDWGTDTQSWFGAFVPADADRTAATIVVVYELFDEAEAVRTLRLIEMLVDAHRPSPPTPSE